MGMGGREGSMGGGVVWVMGQHGGWGSMGFGDVNVGGRKRILAMSIVTIICVCIVHGFTSNFTVAADHDTVLSGSNH